MILIVVMYLYNSFFTTDNASFLVMPETNRSVVCCIYTFIEELVCT